MKSFQQFITEASQDSQELDDVKMSKRADAPLKVGRIGANTKKSPAEKKRVKAIGGGKTAPAKTYKPRKDIGSQRPKSRKEVQPTRERGSAKLSAREAQRKAALERRAAKGDSKSKKDLEKAATKLLTKKKDTVDPKYKPAKASGYTRPERRKIQRAGDRLIGDIRKKKEKPAQHYNPKL